MEMFYVDKDGTRIEYELIPDQPEQLYYETIKFKKSHIKIKTKIDRTDAAKYRELILTEINSELEKKHGENKSKIRR